jgi:Fe-S cluster assembly iron-binding protein IscA
MLFVRCPFCHKLVFRFWYRRHEAKHTERRPDGQMNDHITLPPTDRHDGALAGVPRGYRHPRCGVVTAMPDDIIRSYLVNPFLYSGGSFCCGCSDYMPYEELYWQETGQCLAEYFKQLQEEYIRTHRLNEPETLQQTIAEARKRRKPGITDKTELVMVTPAAAAKLRQVAKECGNPKTWYLRVTMKAPMITLGAANYKLDVDVVMDPGKDVVGQSQGIKTVVAKEHAELIRGIRVNFQSQGSMQGFAVEPPHDQA